MRTSEVELYYRANDRLEMALAQAPQKPRRLALLKYAVDMRLADARAVLHSRDQAVEQRLAELKESIRVAFGGKAVKL